MTIILTVEAMQELSSKLLTIWCKILMYLCFRNNSVWTGVLGTKSVTFLPQKLPLLECLLMTQLNLRSRILLCPFHLDCRHCRFFRRSTWNHSISCWKLIFFRTHILMSLRNCDSLYSGIRTFKMDNSLFKFFNTIQSGRYWKIEKQIQHTKAS